MYGIMAMGLIYILESMVKCGWLSYMGLGCNGCFMTSATMFDWQVGHYRIYIISRVGNPMLDSVKLLVMDCSVQ